MTFYGGRHPIYNTDHDELTTHLRIKPVHDRPEFCLLVWHVLNLVPAHVAGRPVGGRL